MIAAPPPEHRLKGIGYRVVGALCLGLMNAAMKYAGDLGVTAPELFAWRNLFSLPVIVAWVLAGPGLASLRTRRPLGHLVRSGLGIVAMLGLFQGLILLPLAEATTIVFSSPLWGTLFSALLLREVIGPRRWAAVMVGFAGILLVTRPGGAEVPLLGAGIALMSAIAQALVMITLRQLGRTDSTAAIVFWFTVAAAATGAVMLIPFGQSHGAGAWAALAVGGALGGLGQICITAALRHAPVSVVVPFDYIQIVCAILLGWMVWAAAPTALTWAGAALVAGSGIYTAYRERRRTAVPAVAQGPAEV